jgi:hypothetical protein
MTKGELTQKEINFLKVEKELASKLKDIEQTRDQKS